MSTMKRQDWRTLWCQDLYKLCSSSFVRIDSSRRLSYLVPADWSQNKTRTPVSAEWIHELVGEVCSRWCPPSGTCTGVLSTFFMNFCPSVGTARMRDVRSVLNQLLRWWSRHFGGPCAWLGRGARWCDGVPEQQGPPRASRGRSAGPGQKGQHWVFFYKQFF